MRFYHAIQIALMCFIWGELAMPVSVKGPIGCAGMVFLIIALVLWLRESRK